MHNWEWKFYKKKLGLYFLINFGGKLSFILFSFFLSTSPAAANIFTALTCTATIITLKLHNLIKFHYFANITERGGDRGWKQAQREGEDRATFQITLLSGKSWKKQALQFKFSQPMISQLMKLILRNIEILQHGCHSCVYH